VPLLTRAVESRRYLFVPLLGEKNNVGIHLQSDFTPQTPENVPLQQQAISDAEKGRLPTAATIDII